MRDIEKAIEDLTKKVQLLNSNIYTAIENIKRLKNLADSFNGANKEEQDVKK